MHKDIYKKNGEIKSRGIFCEEKGFFSEEAAVRMRGSLVELLTLDPGKICSSLRSKVVFAFEKSLGAAAP